MHVLDKAPCGLALLFPIYYFIVRRILFRSVTTGGSPTGLCGDCAYDLAGLLPNSPCPECGSHSLAISGQRTSLRWAPTHPRLAIFTFATIIPGLLIAQPLATEILSVGYKLDGFSSDAARHAIPMREYYPYSGIYTPPWIVTLPWIISLWSLPLASLFSSRRRAWRVALASLAIGLAASVPWGLLVSR